MQLLMGLPQKLRFTYVHDLYRLTTLLRRKLLQHNALRFGRQNASFVQMKTRVVLASDHKIMRESLRSLFGQAAEAEIVGEAEGVITAPEKARELGPDVVLLEIGFPSRAHGLRAAALIADQSPKVRVLVLTNNSDVPYVRSMMAIGVSGYLLKNCESAQLFAAVQRVKFGGKFIDPSLSDDLIWHSMDKKVKAARSTFSRRELEVFSALIRGYTNAQSADVLQLSVKTVETYRLRIYRKLHLSSRAELVEYALANRFLPDSNPLVTTII
jgi:two-component system response regulator NreC